MPGSDPCVTDLELGHRDRHHADICRYYTEALGLDQVAVRLFGNPRWHRGTCADHRRVGGHRADLFANRDLAEQIGQDQFLVIERFDRAMRSMGGAGGKDRCHFCLIAHVMAFLEKIVSIFSPSL